MKKATIKMDLQNDTATIMGKDVALNLATSGHYYIPIDKSEEVPVETVCAVRPDDLSEQERYKTLLKKGKRKVQGVPQAQTAAFPRPQEEEKTDKSKQAQIKQTYEKH